MDVGQFDQFIRNLGYLSDIFIRRYFTSEAGSDSTPIVTVRLSNNFVILVRQCGRELTFQLKDGYKTFTLSKADFHQILGLYLPISRAFFKRFHYAFQHL